MGAAEAETGSAAEVDIERDTGGDTGSGTVGETEEVGEVVQQTEAGVEDKMKEGDSGDEKEE